MLDQGIIEESSSPWMAPAVFVKKSSGEIRLCVDYRELNKKTVKDAYPLPLSDEAQDRLAGSTIFSTLDLQSGYWQLPVAPEDYANGAVLEQGGHLIAYASHSLTKAEKQYSVIQKECLATIYGMKQFQHYLLGWFFTLMTDHKPLQWLSAQKMEGLLCCWALVMQEYDFIIVYHEGSQNANADALSYCSMVSSPCCGLTMALPDASNEELRIAQCQDPLIKELYNSLHYNHTPSLPGRNHPALRRYKQIWPQLKIIDGIVC